MKSSTAKKKESGAASIQDYLFNHLFKLEESFTLLFLGMFFSFLYLYGTTSSGEDPNDNSSVSVLSRDSIKIAMWISALLAVVAHLTPKKGENGKE